MSWSEALRWLPTAAVVAMTTLGFVALALQPPHPARKYWLVALLAGGALATGVSWGMQQQSEAALGTETARLRELGGHLDALGRLLPAGPGKTPDETFDTVAAAIQALNSKIKDLESQIDALKERTRGRSIAPDAAAKIAALLRPGGRHQVVVSCAPDDIEAYNYANQIANVLREAGWDATGPEKTTIFGEAPGMAVRLYVRAGAAPPDTVKLLIDAFTRFNVPFESGITPNDAIPDPATTELFVSHKP
jgi:hypothetical protein